MTAIDERHGVLQALQALPPGIKEELTAVAANFPVIHVCLYGGYWYSLSEMLKRMSLLEYNGTRFGNLAGAVERHTPAHLDKSLPPK